MCDAQNISTVAFVSASNGEVDAGKLGVVQSSSGLCPWTTARRAAVSVLWTYLARLGALIEFPKCPSRTVRARTSRQYKANKKTWQTSTTPLTPPTKQRPPHYMTLYFKHQIPGIHLRLDHKRLPAIPHYYPPHTVITTLANRRNLMCFENSIMHIVHKGH